MAAGTPRDRLVCGDVGFGKTEVAMRAAFLAAEQGKQVAILVPTTLLAQQHYESLKDRFADWPVEVDVISRFKTSAEQNVVLERVAAGKVGLQPVPRIKPSTEKVADHVRREKTGEREITISSQFPTVYAIDSAAIKSGNRTLLLQAYNRLQYTNKMRLIVRFRAYNMSILSNIYY